MSEVSVTVNGKVMLSADTTQFEADLRRAQQGLIGAGGPTSAHDPATVGRAPDPRSGYIGSPEEAARQATRMYMGVDAHLAGAQTLAELRRLEQRLDRADRYGARSGDEHLIDALKDLRRALEDRRTDLTDAASGGAGGGSGSPPAPPSPPPPPGGTPPWLAQLGQALSQQGSSAAGGLLGRALGGGALGSLAGGGLGAMLGGPVGWVLGGLTAATGAFKLADRYITDENRLARQEVEGQADLARQYGIDRDLMGTFRPGGFTNARFARLGYDATEAARVAALYNRPGGMLGDTESILQFSRTTGMQADRIAPIAQALSYAGVGTEARTLNRGGNVDEGLRVLKLAVSEGLKDGIDGNTTMQNLVGFVKQGASEGRSVSTAGMALFAQLTDRLTGTRGGSAVIRGEGAANIVQSVLGGIGSPNDPGLEYLLLNAIGAPSAFAAGMTERGTDGQMQRTGEGAVYDGIRASSPLEAGRYLLDRIKGGKNPQLLYQAMQGIDDAAGDNTALKYRLYQTAFGLSPEQSVQLMNAGGAEAFRSDPKMLQKFIQGQSNLSDTQGKNDVNNDSQQLGVAERDRKMLDSLGNLAALGDMQMSLSSIKDDMAKVRYSFMTWLGGYGNPEGSLQGRAGESYTDPRGVPRPTREAPVAGGAGGAATAGTPVGTGGSALDRTMWALAQVETSGGTNIKTSSTGAEGLYQIQPQNISKTWQGAGSAGGWDKDVLGEDARDAQGNVITTTEGARAWLKANPDKAARIAAGITQQRMARIRKSWDQQGVKYTDADVAGMAGAWWTASDGGVLDGSRVMRPEELRDAQTASEKSHGSASPGMYFDRAKAAYQRSLEFPAVPTHQATGGPPEVTYPGKAGDAFLDNVAGGGAMTLTQGYGDNAAYVDPKTGKVVDRFGYGKRGHNGWDIALGKAGIDGKTGAPIYSPFMGKLFMGTQRGKDGKPAGYGHWVKLIGESGASILFGHLNRFPAGVRSGQVVHDGDVIGYEGSSGNSTNAHVHVEVRDPKGNAVDPNTLLGGWMRNQGAKAAQGQEAGFQHGGWTGSGPAHGVAGPAHFEEFVVRAGPATRYRGLLERVNAGLPPGDAGAPAASGRIELNVTGGATFDVRGVDGGVQAKIDVLWREFLAGVGGALQGSAPVPSDGPR